MQKTLTIFAFLIIYCCLNAQDSIQAAFSADYTTELQTNFGKKYNWVNFLSLSGELPTEKINRHWKNGAFYANIISIYKIFDVRIADDLLAFSNIEEDNLPFNFFMLGYEHSFKKVSIFGGVRNVNYDYFATPYTSLFTNSSAGIFPTLSINFPLANFPVSAICLHVEYQPNEKWLLKNSLYNGTVHNPRENIFSTFSVKPQEDGIFDMLEVQYLQNKFLDGIYTFGIGTQAFSRQKENTFSLWITAEQAVFRSKKREIGLLMHGGFAPPSHNDCYTYYAVGTYFSGLLMGKNTEEFGIYFNHAFFSATCERTLEITWKYQIIKQLSIHPTFHFIRTGGKTEFIGLLRIKAGFGN